MGTAFRHGNYTIQVLPERGQRHHRPHAHILLRGARVACVYIETLTLYDVIEKLPRSLVDRLETEQETMLELWVELNESQ
jgi:hypothetical protein